MKKLDEIQKPISSLWEEKTQSINCVTRGPLFDFLSSTVFLSASVNPSSHFSAVSDFSQASNIASHRIMGISLDLFVEDVDPHLVCAICSEVFVKPVTLDDGCVFCRVCIHQWIQTTPREDPLFCPNDRNPISVFKRIDLGGDNRILVKLINKLKVICPFRLCKKVFPVEDYETHLSNCEYNPIDKEKVIKTGSTSLVGSCCQASDVNNVKLTHHRSSLASFTNSTSENIKVFDGEFWKCGSQRLTELEYRLYKLKMEFERESVRVDRYLSRDEEDVVQHQEEEEEGGWDKSVKVDSFIKCNNDRQVGSTSLSSSMPVCNLSLDWEDVSECPLMIKFCKKLTKSKDLTDKRLVEIVKRVDARLDYVYNIDDKTLLRGSFTKIRHQVRFLNHIAPVLKLGSTVLLKTTDLAYLSRFFLMCLAYMVGRRGSIYITSQWAEYVSTIDESIAFQSPTNVEIYDEDDEISPEVKFDLILDCCGAMETYVDRLKENGLLLVINSGKVQLLKKVDQ